VIWWKPLFDWKAKTARDVIKAYLGPEGTPEAVDKLYHAVIDFFNGEAPNPFRDHHRRKIGFFKDQEAGDPAAVQNVRCQNCGNLYPENSMNECPFCLAEAYKEATSDGKKQPEGKAPNSDRYNGDRYNSETGKEGTKQRTCKNCGQPFTYKHWAKKYCSDQCRLDFHAKKHDGEAFNPKQYHRGRRK